MHGKVFVFLLIIVSSEVYGAQARFREARFDILQRSKGLRSPIDKQNFCQGCRSIVSFATSFNATDTRDEYKGVLKSFCQSYYPASTDYQQGPCPLFIESFYFLLGRVDPVYHCDDIGACDPEPSNSIKLHAEDDGMFCQACEEVITILKDQLDDETYVDLIRAQAKELCTYLEIVGKSKECDFLVDKYINQAIDFIKNINPNAYCRSINVCQPKPTMLGNENKLPSLASFRNFGIETGVEIDGKSVKNLDTDINQMRGSPNCVFCKEFVREMFKFLKENRTEESVRAGLDKVCKLIYREGQKFEQCEHLVATYARELIEILVDETDPQMICMLLEQCSYKKPDGFELLEQQPKSAPISMSQFISMLDPQIEVGSFRTCVECKLFIKYLQGQVENPESQEEMESWLMTNLCGSLETGELQKSCREFVQDKSPAFFKAIASELDPKTACVDLGACKDRARSTMLIDFLNYVNMRPVLLQPKPQSYKVKNQVCDQCIDVVSKIDEYLSSHSIDNDISVLIDQVCNKLPTDSSKEECVLLVKTFGQEIIQAITTMDSPRQLCSKLLLC